MVDQLAFHFLTHRFEVGILGEVEPGEHGALLPDVLHQGVPEDGLGVSQLLGHVLDPLMDPLPQVGHGLLLRLLHSPLNILLDASQFC